MPETDHAIYLALLAKFYAKSKLSDDDLRSLTQLHIANIARVSQIVTE